MKNLTMIYQEVLKKRLERKKVQLADLERIIKGEGEPTPIEKRKFIELKAVILELENVIDIAESMFEDKE